MIPILQFDPSSLAIWYDAHLVNRMRGSTDIGSAIDFTLRADYTALVDHVECVEDKWVRTRAAAVAGAVFHEKRHFLDFVLTNYGAFRLRQFFMMYANIPAVIKNSMETGELLVPLQSYLERIFCRELGVKPPAEDILAMARDVVRRKKMVMDDRQLVSSRFGSKEIGGEAILESLAHHFEVTFVQLLFGGQMLQDVRADVPDESLLQTRYQWLYEILAAADLMEIRQTESDLSAINVPAFVPICYAALACRLWKQPQSEMKASYLPNYRLARLVPELHQRRRELRSAHITAAWELVNRACHDVFGRTCLEETSVDLDYEERLIETLTQRDPNSLEVRAYQDFHSLRKKLFQKLKEDPSAIVADLDYFAFSPSLQPLVVVAAGSGEPGVPPQDYDRLLGYKDPEGTETLDEWWWAAIARDWPEIEKPDILSVKDKRAWIDIISDAAPFAKLLMDGRNIRTMLGPEILSAEMRVRNRFKIDIKVDPRYAFPRNRITADNWFYLTGQKSFRCDVTWESVKKPEGVAIDAWTLRLWPGLIDHLMGRMADKKALMRSLQRDWSPWLLSEEFRELFEESREDRSLLVETNWGGQALL